MEQYHYEMHAFILFTIDHVPKDYAYLLNYDKSNEVIEKFTIHNGNTIVRKCEVITDDPKSRPSISIERFDFHGCFYSSKFSKRNSIGVAYKKMNLPINQLINCGYNVAMSLYGQKIDDNHIFLFGYTSDTKAGILSKIIKDIFTELEKKELSKEGTLRLSHSVSIRCYQIIGNHFYDLLSNESESDFYTFLDQSKEFPDNHKNGIKTDLLTSKVARTAKNAINLINDAKQRSVYVVEVGKAPPSMENSPEIIVHGEIGQTIIVIEVEQVLYLAHQRKCVLRKSNLEIFDFAPLSSFTFQKKKENQLVMCTQNQLQLIGEKTAMESDTKIQKKFLRAMNINIETNLWLSSAAPYQEHFHRIYSESVSALTACSQLLHERRHIQLCKDAGLHIIPPVPESDDLTPGRFNGGSGGTENKLLTNILKSRIFGNYCMFHLGSFHSAQPTTSEALRVMYEWKGVMGSVTPSESDLDCTAMALKVSDHRLKFNSIYYNERNSQLNKNMAVNNLSSLNQSNPNAANNHSNKISTDNTPSLEFNFRIDVTPTSEIVMNANMMEKLKLFKKLSYNKKGETAPGVVPVSKNRVSFRLESPGAEESLTNSKINYNSYESGGSGMSILKRESSTSLLISSDKDIRDSSSSSGGQGGSGGLPDLQISRDKSKSLEGDEYDANREQQHSRRLSSQSSTCTENHAFNNEENEQEEEEDKIDVFDTELRLLLFQVLHDMTSYVNSITGKFLTQLAASKSPPLSTRSEDISPITPCPIPINLESSMSLFAKGDIEPPTDLSPEEKIAWYFITCPAVALYEKHLETLELRLREIPELFTSMESSFVDITRYAGLISVNISKVGERKSFSQKTLSLESMKSWEVNNSHDDAKLPKIQPSALPPDTFVNDANINHSFRPKVPGRDKVLDSQYNTIMVKATNHYPHADIPTTTITNTAYNPYETKEEGGPPPPIALRGTTFWNFNSSFAIAEAQLKLKLSEVDLLCENLFNFMIF